jgi:hypothetical protein
MSTLQGSLLSVWDDLRARRLLPVAVLLVAALVAVPLLLTKDSEEPAPPAPPATTDNQAKEPEGPEALAQVKLDELAPGTGSSLSSFDPSNPFAPPEKVVAAALEEESGGGVEQPTTGGEAAPVTGGGTGDTGTGDTGSGDTGSGDTGGDQGGGQTETTEFTYVLDLTFWANGRKRKVKGMQKLDMLPSEASPLLIFMGVTDGGGNAAFLVDSTLQTAGEGKCRPSRDECGVLYLGPGSEQEFTNEEGDSYRLLIDQIRRVKVDDLNGSAASTSKADSKTANAALGEQATVRRFAPPLLADVIVESTLSGDDSTSADERR